MYRALGLSRDPFAPVVEPELFWESPDRAVCREAALRELRGSGGVWLRGPAGSGRQSVLERVAQDLAVEGQRVLWVHGEAVDSGDSFLRDLFAVLDSASPPQECLSAAETLYTRLLGAFAEAGPSVIVFGASHLAVEALAEAEILAGLRVAGVALVRLALSGAGPAPFPGLKELPLSPFSEEDTRACLLHRASACGAPGLLPLQELAGIAEKARGIGDAMEQARTAICRAAFRSAVLAAKPKEASGLLDIREVDEVGRLLDALSPEG